MADVCCQGCAGMWYFSIIRVPAMLATLPMALRAPPLSKAEPSVRPTLLCLLPQAARKFLEVSPDVGTSYSDVITLQVEPMSNDSLRLCLCTTLCPVCIKSHVLVQQWHKIMQQPCAQLRIQ
jgi:hypothetical protein